MDRMASFSDWAVVMAGLAILPRCQRLGSSINIVKFPAPECILYVISHEVPSLFDFTCSFLVLFQNCWSRIR